MNRYLYTLFLLVAVSQGTRLSPTGSEAQPSSELNRIRLTSNHVTPLQVIVRIGVDKRLPIGIVFGPQPTLCSEQASLTVDAANFEEAFSQILKGTGYSVQIQNGVYSLLAPDVTEHEASLLAYRFDRFSAVNSTLRAAGALLGGYIMVAAEGAKGFAGDSPYRLSAKRFDIQLQSATTTQIANHIVSLGGKGIWVFRPVKATAAGDESSIQIYGYEDNAADLERLACM
jgi:hypothetical protein